MLMECRFNNEIQINYFPNKEYHLKNYHLLQLFSVSFIFFLVFNLLFFYFVHKFFSVFITLLVIYDMFITGTLFLFFVMMLN